MPYNQALNLTRCCRAGFLVETPPIETVNQEIVDQIVEQQYVVFHHNETTGRDVGGFHSNG